MSVSGSIEYKKPPIHSRVATAFKHWTYRLRVKYYESILDYALRNHPNCKNSNIVKHADRELKLAGYTDPDAFYGDLLYIAVMRQARLFSIEGHSGMSAGIAAGLTEQVCMFRPIAPLTGEDDEWVDCGDDLFQNNRMSSIFKQGKNGQAYWNDGKIFEEPDGARFTSSESRVPVKFPWSYRKPKIVKVQKSE